MQIQQQRDDTLQECLKLKGQNRVLNLRSDLLLKQNNMLKEFIKKNTIDKAKLKSDLEDYKSLAQSTEAERVKYMSELKTTKVQVDKQK